MRRDDAMKPDEVESQLSAMFDGELPAAECELLSRRIDRDDNLRARWSRYALIGAAMRCEPVATARGDFAVRVSRAVDRAVEGAEERAGARGLPSAGGRAARSGSAVSAAAQREPRLRRLWWQSALAASLVTAVAGLSIVMLRTVALGPGRAVPAVPVLAVSGAAPQSVAAQSSEQLLARARQAAAILGLASPTPQATAARVSSPSVATVPARGREPWSYVTPVADSPGSTPLRTELVDYIVAHSEYSTPLLRPDLLSEVISSGDAAEAATPAAAAGEVDAISPPAAVQH